MSLICYEVKEEQQTGDVEEPRRKKARTGAAEATMCKAADTYAAEGQALLDARNDMAGLARLEFHVPAATGLGAENSLCGEPLF